MEMVCHHHSVIATYILTVAEGLCVNRSYYGPQKVIELVLLLQLLIKITIFLLTLSIIAHLAVDWITDKIYLSAYQNGTISVIDIHTGSQVVLFNFSLTSYRPSDLVVDPNTRLAFIIKYTSWHCYNTV